MSGIEKVNTDVRGYELVKKALQLVEERFETGFVPDRLFYHVCDHTVGVINTVWRITEAMNLSERERLVAVTAAAFHDVAQTSELVQKDGGILLRRRFAGRNETVSAFEMVEEMCRLSPSLLPPFTPDEYAIATSAVTVTTPGWSVEHGTVIQPRLNESSHPIVRAVALADLASPGMYPEVFAQDGWALFAEDNVDVMLALQASVYHDVRIDVYNRGLWRARLVGWLKSQAGFARGRQALLSSELKGLDVESRRRVADLFCHFEESIALAEENVQWAEQADFVSLMRKLLPDAFSFEQ